ncbi:response regulator [Desulfovulcanus sp.]
MRILLVDDEKELVSTLAERLSFRGIKADWATNAQDALKLVRENGYDLSLLDVKMPKPSGFDFMEMIKEIKPNMKFGFLTGHGSEAAFKESCSKGACFYLVKPVQIDELISKLKEILGG